MSSESFFFTTAVGDAYAAYDGSIHPCRSSSLISFSTGSTKLYGNLYGLL